MTPGNRLRRARKLSELSLTQVEEETARLGAKISSSSLSELELDKPSRLSIPQLKALSLVLGVSLEWVLFDEEYPAYAIGKHALNLPESARKVIFTTMDLLKQLVENK